jgi:hypothetical protein
VCVRACAVAVEASPGRAASFLSSWAGALARVAGLGKGGLQVGALLGANSELVSEHNLRAGQPGSGETYRLALNRFAAWWAPGLGGRPARHPRPHAVLPPSSPSSACHPSARPATAQLPPSPLHAPRRPDARFRASSLGHRPLTTAPPATAGALVGQAGPRSAEALEALQAQTRRGLKGYLGQYERTMHDKDLPESVDWR